LNGKFIDDFVRHNVKHIALSYLEVNPMHGYSLISTIRKDLGVYLGPSTVYPTLKALEEDGLVESTWNFEGERPRKVYEITRNGLRTLNSQRITLLHILPVIMKSAPELEVLESRFNRRVANEV
jgi:DNA-binding PadR family transcriptional regulator